MATDGLTRRNTLTGAAALGVGVPLLAACGGDDGSDGSSATPSTQAGETLAATSDVPVGGGTVLTDDKLVVTQPSDGTFKCFSAVCPHQGCRVSDVDGGTINCTCHGSKFSIDDGSVVNGPATSGLPAVAVEVDGDSVVTG